MATEKTKLNVVGLDFLESKDSLKAFLKSQDTLKDYDFDGSVINTILDVLAYNNHYQAFYANMVANEMFLDTAVVRSSIASHAKTLGYVPSSRRASKAVLSIELDSTGIPSTSTSYLSRGSQFLGIDSSGRNYTFVLLETVYANTETNSFEDVTVYEGSLRRVSYVYNPTRKSSSILTIPSDKIDTTTLSVRVKASATDNSGIGDVWSVADSYIDLTPTSKVYFLQEREAGMYELFFGDGFLGLQPEAGSVVVIEYLETSGDEANGVRSFTSTVSGLGNITVVEPSVGGSQHESSYSVKFTAPRYYQSQSRAVTEDDYKALVMKDYPNAETVFVYGGETIVPPQYGKVFIAIKPKSGSFLADSEKKTLQTLLRKNRSVVTIVPEIVDAEFIDVLVDSYITFDPSKSSLSASVVKALVASYLMVYSNAQLETFGSNLYLSTLVQGINLIDPGILGNQTTLKMKKTVDLNTLSASKGISIEFNNPILKYEGGCGSTVLSKTISHPDVLGNIVTDTYVEDDGLGVLNVVVNSGDTKKTVYPNVGTVDYEAGRVSFNSKFAPVYLSPIFFVTVIPSNHDLFVSQNKILRINRGHTDSVTIKIDNVKTRIDNIRK